MYSVYTDSSIKPMNPGGLLTWAFIVKHKKGVIFQNTDIIGWGRGMTNNLGEMTAVLKAMEWLLENGKNPAIINSDSQLIVNQCSGKWGCNEKNLKDILIKINKISVTYAKRIIFNWIPREKNKEADELSRSFYTEKAINILKANKNNILLDFDNIKF